MNTAMDLLPAGTIAGGLAGEGIADAPEEIGQVPIRMVPLGWLVPSPENDRLYRPADPSDPAIVRMAEGMQVEGQLEPSVATADGYIVSGHRRHVGAGLAGLDEVPCRVLGFRRADDPDRFLRLLRQFNEQRVKSHDEMLREAILDANPDDERRALVEHRRKQLRELPVNVEMGERRHRARISAAKRPMLNAVLKILSDNKAFWPLSERSIHYQLQNNPPLRHASKPDSTYRNTLQSYKDLSNLLTRARLTREVPMHAISDETRPITTWRTFNCVAEFVAKDIDGFLKGYYRDLMRSQPDHVEIICEKMTLKNVIDDVAGDYTIPTTIGRGYGSVPPRNAMAQRFRKSGKGRMVVLILTDFDPEGENIAETFARSMRDEFGVPNIMPIKVALTREQIDAHRLPVKMQAKEKSSRFKGFSAKHGNDVFELEALPLKRLQELLRQAIDSVIDVDAFNHEIEFEKADAQYLAGVRQVVARTLTEMKLGGAAKRSS